MSLTPGSRLGSYEILAAIGAGGMGEVFRARDTKLNRDVAIKVLLPAVANDPDRLARFSREAQVLASLNHPNIAHIYGLDRQDGREGHEATSFLIMELVEGEELAARIAREAIPLDEALPIAKQIAEALEAAHEQGIIHRDLKPANIKIRPDGTVKVLDFGLAKAIEQGSGLRAQGSGNAMNSPTLSMHATQAGIILGTAAYMSPEQAAGKAVDKRSDLWAFGVVLLEMLTGRQVFAGETTSHVLAAVLKDAPDWTTLPAHAPAAIRRLLRRCLEKDRSRRLDSAADARLEIDDALTAPVEEAPRVVPPRRAGAFWFALAVAGVIVAVIGAAAGWVTRAPASAETVAFRVDTPASRRLDWFAISPDGRQLAFVAIDKDGQERLWLRPLASVEARVLAGTNGASSPFWSPDSRKVAFFASNELKRVDVSGGEPQTICRTPGIAGGGAWNEQEVILFSIVNASGVLRVAATGGEPQTVTTLKGSAIAHQWPVFMPDGRHFIYLSMTGQAEGSQLMWGSLDSSDEHVVRTMFSKAFYSPPGYLVFRLGGPIVAQHFDPVRGTVSGATVQVTSDTIQPGTQTALAVSSSAGVLAHRGGQANAVAQLSWIERDGKALTAVGAAADYRNPFLDLAGERIVANLANPSDVWLLDARRGTTSRLTFEPAPDSDPVFSPDGRWVAFYSGRQPQGIYRKASSGAGADELVAATGAATYPRDWSLDGRFLLYDSGPAGTMWALPTDGDRKPVRFPPGVPKGAQVTAGHFSGDGKWVAYVSDETNRSEIFVQDFPAGATKFQVSVAGGTEPRWRRDGRELFFLGADGQMMAVDVENAPTLRLGVPKVLFETRLNRLAGPSRRYGVSADGQRFLMNVPIGTDAVAPITVILNRTAGVKK